MGVLPITIATLPKIMPHCGEKLAEMKKKIQARFNLQICT